MASTADGSPPIHPGTNGTADNPPSQTSGVAVAGAKRRGEDLTQYATKAARRQKLKSASEKQVVAFAAASPAEREVWMAAMIIKVIDSVETIQSGEAQTKLSATLYDKIETYSSKIILCPSLTRYRDEPTKIIIGILERHPRWGLTPEVKDNKASFDPILSRAQTRLTERRGELKSLLTASLSKESRGATNIVDLVQRAINKMIKGSKVSIAVDVKVNLQMCARFAFLRKVLVESNGTSFWQVVDEQLKSLREKCDEAPNGDALKSQFFKLVLEEDLRQYGVANLDDISQNDISRSDTEVEIEAFATQTQHNLESPDDDADATS
ncbi:hypothetical protein BXZ70DRAFT_903157 [Cristinia sonorae]|uniref:Uncharacterized protein n=1 Tax=Cristinia sonorae TaxID=1940300 RepID=A0A8K0UZ00_9AGAR|nr:hypothetical protein BXZ70DRAFT_903157 [Cristinia sonorae]